MAEKNRWQYRFDNYRRSYILLQEAAEIVQGDDVVQLTKEGAIRRFKICTELAWQVMKDYLEYQGVNLKEILPRPIIKDAVAGKLISNGEIWMDIVDARNKMSHVFSESAFEVVLDKLNTRFMPCFAELYEVLALKYES